METAREMIRQAKLSGADAIKFQHHIPEEEMLRDGVPMSSNFNMPLFEFLKLYALTIEQHAELREFCDRTGIIYLCTPFSTRAASEISKLVPAFKIGSGELTDIPSLKRIAQMGKPMILSSGMSTLSEIDETIEALRPVNDQLVLLNCTSEYPANYEDINLGLIPILAERYKLPVGHSDHTPDIYTCIAAAALGASVLEKHIILDKKQPGPDQCVSIQPYELSLLVDAVRKIELALGNDKRIHEQEKPIRSWAHRSVVTLSDIPAGTILTEDLIWTKRPGTGTPAKHLEEFLGRKAIRDLKQDYLIKFEDVQ
jgi:N-acetylneuraminate synthase